jgi:hypothetical protein
MNITFYNYDLLGKRMSYTFPLMMDLIEEHKTKDFEQLQILINEKFPYGAEHGKILIDSKILNLLNPTKEEIKSIIKIEENQTLIYNKDFKKIINRIDKLNKYNKNYNVNLSMLRLFFKCSLNAKTEYISLYLKSNEL